MKLSNTKLDHLSPFTRKNHRFGKYSTYPQSPSKNDTKTEQDYKNELEEIRIREQYADGLHVNPTYTTIAHYFLIKQLLNAPKWRFVTDNDSSILTALNRVFMEEIKGRKAHHFLHKIDGEKSLQEAYDEHVRAIKYLKQWGEDNEIKVPY